MSRYVKKGARHMAKGKEHPFLKKYGSKILAICFWLFLWEAVSRIMGQELLLASPSTAVWTLIKLMIQMDFWETIAFTLGRILLGFILAIVIGTFLAVAAFRSRILEELIQPLMEVAKSLPVASFIFLALFWMKARNVSTLISFLMVVPVIYINVKQGLEVADEALLQMAKVFGISRWKKVRAIYIPTVMPYFVSAVSVGLGFCWKSGIAAEAIGTPTGSIGEKLYEAKLYLMSDELFAWTLAIVAVIVLFEKALMFLLKPMTKNINHPE
jgi:NitT/TauT family transport system permease protein